MFDINNLFRILIVVPRKRQEVKAKLSTYGDLFQIKKLPTLITQISHRNHDKLDNPKK